MVILIRRLLSLIGLRAGDEWIHPLNLQLRVILALLFLVEQTERGCDVRRELTALHMDVVVSTTTPPRRDPNVVDNGSLAVTTAENVQRLAAGK